VPSIRMAMRSETCGELQVVVTIIAVSVTPWALSPPPDRWRAERYRARRRLVVEHQLRLSTIARAMPTRFFIRPRARPAASRRCPQADQRELLDALGHLGLGQWAPGAGTPRPRRRQRVEERGPLEDEPHPPPEGQRLLAQRRRLPRASIRPRSGLMRPAIRRRMTVLPDPLPPITVTVAPRGTSTSRPRSTTFRSNDFQTCSKRIAASAMAR
jgi:hypothetical protein